MKTELDSYKTRIAESKEALKDFTKLGVDASRISALKNNIQSAETALNNLLNNKSSTATQLRCFRLFLSQKEHRRDIICNV